MRAEKTDPAMAEMEKQIMGVIQRCVPYAPRNKAQDERCRETATNVSHTH